MSSLEQTLEALQHRVEALEQENARLRRQIPTLPSGEQGASRRQVLVGGAGVLSALAGATLWGRGETVHAAGAAPLQQHLQSLAVTLTPLRSRGVLWARHEWELGPHFSGPQPPVVMATAADDYIEHDLEADCSCAVTVHGTPGAYRAVILVRNISQRASEVTVQALAISS